MILYAFYNADLIDIAQGKNELTTGFVDDCAFAATGDTLEETHNRLKDMMDRSQGGLEWSRTHNSQFEISKLAIMDFPRPNTKATPTRLIITTQHPGGTAITNEIANVQTYKYLGVVFDPRLSWKAHTSKVTTNATRWAQQLWRITKTAGGFISKT
jgi:hypothetical protein